MAASVPPATPVPPAYNMPSPQNDRTRPATPAATSSARRVLFTPQDAQDQSTIAASDPEARREARLLSANPQLAAAVARGREAMGISIAALDEAERLYAHLDPSNLVRIEGGSRILGAAAAAMRRL